MSTIKIALYICMIVFSLAFGMIPIIIGKMAKKAEKNMDESRKEIENKWKNKKSFFSYEKIKLFLTQNGADFHFEKIKEPVSFIEISILLGFLIAAVCFLVYQPLAIPGYILGLFLPALILVTQNSQDNKDMLFDISIIYNALYTQIQAGVFPEAAIRECYSVVQHPRLRKAMLVLTGNMERRDLSFEDALKIFKNSFDNSQIESLTIIMEQAKSSGKAADALKDVLDQVKEIEESILFLKKEKQGTRNQVLQIMFFAGIVAIIITYSMQMIYSTMLSF